MGVVHLPRLAVAAVLVLAAGCADSPGTPVWLSDTEVFVHGGYYQHARSAAGDTYRVRYEGGRWAVVELRTGWIT